jgi:hypothetical protein
MKVITRKVCQGVWQSILLSPELFLKWLWILKKPFLAVSHFETKAFNKYARKDSNPQSSDPKSR